MLTQQSSAVLSYFIAASIAYVLITMISGYIQAWIAKKLGDRTAEHLGFLSFNPVIYIDPLGFLFFFLTGFGWGKIVPINPFYFSSKHKRFELFFAYASRPLVNGILGFMTLCTLDIGFGGYLLKLPKLTFIAQHVALDHALKSILMLMTQFGFYFSLFGAILIFFRMFVLQLLGSFRLGSHESELLSTFISLFLIMLFRYQVEYLLRVMVIAVELFTWYWWHTVVSMLGVLSWYS
jgi:hypothetical protein